MAKKKSETKTMVICDNCGKCAPIDKERSTENWTVYTTSSPCECGGHWIPSFLKND